MVNNKSMKPNRNTWGGRIYGYDDDELHSSIVSAFSLAKRQKMIFSAQVQDTIQYVSGYTTLVDISGWTAPEMEIQLGDLGMPNFVDVVDTSPQRMWAEYATNLCQSITPETETWFNLAPKGMSPSISREDALALEQIKDTISWHLTEGGAYTALPQSYLDTAWGLAGLYIQENPRIKGYAPFTISCVPARLIYISQDSKDGHLRTVFRYFASTYDDIMSTYDVEKPDYVQDGDLGAMRLFTEMVTPMDFYYKDEGDTEQSRQEVFFRVILDEKGGIIDRQAMSYNPLIVWRWGLTPGNLYGSGPLLNAKGDILSLHTLQDSKLHAAQLTCNPALLVNSDLLSVGESLVNVVPGQIINFSQPFGKDTSPIIPIPLTGDANMVQSSATEMQQSIRDTVHSSPIVPVTAAVRTATELDMRQQENLQQLSNMNFGRVQSELVRPLIFAALQILYGRNEVNQNLQIQNLDISHKSYASFNQDQAQAQKIPAFVQLAGNIAQLQSQSTDLNNVLDFNNILDTARVGMNLPSTMMKEEDSTRDEAQEIAENFNF